MTGDRSGFTDLVERHWRELHVHCYRMLGSFDEAEDLVQETFLRAWRARERIGVSRQTRAWLYRIATNACLDVLRKRPQPSELQSVADISWIQPYPDRLLDELASSEDEPEAVAVSRESIELAFLAVIQLLPPRQRAVLIAREVLGWPAAETANLLDMTVSAVNSALQRARTKLRDQLPAHEDRSSIAKPTSHERALLERYVDAHSRSDPVALASLMRSDVRVAMPPHPMRFDSLDALKGLFERGFNTAEFCEWLLVPTAANRMPAAACYLRAPAGSDFRPYKIDVLRIEDGGIGEITSFGGALFPAFGLPEHLTAGPREARR
jgi:RNA polymerase sigma-70 factor (TIGR02960 family)